jgi:hypothetical protein
VTWRFADSGLARPSLDNQARPYCLLWTRGCLTAFCEIPPDSTPAVEPEETSQNPTGSCPYLITRRFVGAEGTDVEFCDTVISTPAMLIVADRDMNPEFAGIE